VLKIGAFLDVKRAFRALINRNGSMRICVILVMETPTMKVGLISMEVDSIKLRELFN
jgi:hypothetical protein